MVRQPKRKLQPLIDSLLAHGDHFELNQVFRLLQRVLKPQEVPQFRPKNSLAFPASSITSYQFTSGRPIIEVTCMGLYGVSSPLPHYFITDALDEGNEALRHFLSLFNQIFYLAYFDAWKKKHFYLFHDTALQGHAIIAALASQDFKSEDSQAQVAHHFLMENRHAHGLSALLKSLYPGVSTELTLGSAQWQPVLNRATLGKINSPLQLSDNITLGQRFLVNAQHVGITLGPVSDQEARALSPTHSLGKISFNIIKKFLHPILSIDFTVKVNCSNPSSILGHSIGLGGSAFLNSKQQTYQVLHVCKFRP